MKTYNTRFRSVEKLKDFLSLHNINKDEIVLIQIFSGKIDILTIENLNQTLKNLLPNSTIIGSTTDGEIVDGRVLHNNIIISFTIFEKTSIDIASIEFEDKNYFECAKNLTKEILRTNTKAIIFFATSNQINGDKLIDGIKSAIGDKKVAIAGALAADNGNFNKSYIFTSTSILHNGIVAVSLNSDKLIANVISNTNCEPVGREFKITKADQNIIYEIDHTPIKELYKKYLGASLTKNLPLSNHLFPFIIKKDKNLVARSAIDIQKNGSFVFGGEFENNQSIQIAFINIDKIDQNSNEFINKVAKNSIESIFVFCSNSKRRFFPLIGNYETKNLEKIAPTCGFFGYGEFISNGTQNSFLNQSTTVLTLSETKKEFIKPPSVKNQKLKDVNLNYEIIKALSNIAKVSSYELQELNQKLKSKIDKEVKKSVKKDAILIHTSRLAQMGEMMALIAHQWRQPLSAISATSSGLAIKAELDRYDKEFFLDNLNKIEDYVAHLSTTIDDFTNFFKPTKTKEAVFVKDMIKKALFILSPSIAKNSIAIKKEYNSKTKVKTYPNEVVQVIINIMKNAENILLKRKIKNPLIHIKEYEKNSNHIIEISDNGGGVDESIMDKIFDPYFSTKSSEKSTGLGLYMSKFIIEDSCGGRLLVENTQEGAKFTIILKN